MERMRHWQIFLAAVLLALSTVFYFIHYLVFRDMHHILLYLIGDIAFLFIDVLIVMLVLHRLLVFREKQSVLKKLNMVIGTFFSEVGIDLLKLASCFDAELAGIGRQLVITKDWTDAEFKRMRRKVEARESSISSKTGDIAKVKNFLVGKRQFLLVLLENPNLLEHESFSNLLWAVFHLTDELAHRHDVTKLSEPDYEHLSGDIKRAYQQLIVQWLDYMRHLKHDYPYLFSLALRMNPFDPDAAVEIR